MKRDTRKYYVELTNKQCQQLNGLLLGVTLTSKDMKFIEICNGLIDAVSNRIIKRTDEVVRTKKGKAK